MLWGDRVFWVKVQLWGKSNIGVWVIKNGVSYTKKHHIKDIFKCEKPRFLQPKCKNSPWLKKNPSPQNIVASYRVWKVKLTLSVSLFGRKSSWGFPHQNKLVSNCMARGVVFPFLLKAESGINGKLLALELFHTVKTDNQIWLLVPITLYKYFPYLDKDFSLSTYGKTEIRLTWAKFWLFIRSWRYDR